MKKRTTAGGHISSFFANSFPDTTKRDFIRWASLIVVFSLFGLLIVFMQFRVIFGLGDDSTFFQFARDIVHGEAIYKDFIHFRTPGSYFLNAFFVHTFGDKVSSLTFAEQFEYHVLYTIVFGAGLAIFFRFKRVLMSSILLLLTVLLSFQLRAGLGFLAIVLYIQATRVSKYKNPWLVLAGIFAGLTFTFGQEVAVMVGLTVFVAEFCLLRETNWRVVLKNLALFCLGSLIGLLPLLTYILLASNIQNFLYYTLYYAFVLQPRAMDIPYPVFAYANVLYYIIPALLVFYFYIFYSAKRIGTGTAILLAFTVARLATSFGRSDIGHLLFALPEVLVMTFLAVESAFKADYNLRSFYRFLPYGLVLVASLALAMKLGSTWVALGVIAIMVAFTLRKAPPAVSRISDQGAIILAVLVGLVAIFAYLLFPVYNSSVLTYSLKAATPRSIGGVNVTKTEFGEINDVKTAVSLYHPTTIFSFPIQAFYYTLAPKQATRFVTFEAETTNTEQDQAISDLERTKPQVVIMDPAQASELSKAVWKISNYVTTHYKIAKVIKSDRILWVMTPGTAAFRDELAFSVYRNNNESSGAVHDVQSPEKGIVDGLKVSPRKTGVFDVMSDARNKSLQFAIYQDHIGELADCVTVQLDSHQTKVCSDEGQVNINIGNARTIRFTNSSSQQDVILNGVAIVNN